MSVRTDHPPALCRVPPTSQSRASTATNRLRIVLAVGQSAANTASVNARVWRPLQAAPTSTTGPNEGNNSGNDGYNMENLNSALPDAQNPLGDLGPVEAALLEVQHGQAGQAGQAGSSRPRPAGPSPARNNPRHTRTSRSRSRSRSPLTPPPRSLSRSPPRNREIPPPQRENAMPAMLPHDPYWDLPPPSPPVPGVPGRMPSRQISELPDPVARREQLDRLQNADNAENVPFNPGRRPSNPNAVDDANAHLHPMARHGPGTGPLAEQDYPYRNAAALATDDDNDQPSYVSPVGQDPRPDDDNPPYISPVGQVSNPDDDNPPYQGLAADANEQTRWRSLPADPNEQTRWRSLPADANEQTRWRNLGSDSGRS